MNVGPKPPTTYPRETTEDPVIVLKPWHWVVLSFVSLQSYLLYIFTPSLRWTRTQFYSVVEIIQVDIIILLFLLPFLFAGGSLAKVVWHRCRVLSSPRDLGVAAVYPVFLVLFAFFEGRMKGVSPIRLSPVIDYFAFGRGLMSPRLFLIFVSSVLERFATLNLYLLMIAIPKSRQRFNVFGMYALTFLALTLSGEFIRNMVYPSHLIHHLPLDRTFSFWLAASILDEITYFIILWVLDRLAFPSFQPILLMTVLVTISALFMEWPTQWYSVFARFSILIIVLGVSILQRGVLQWPWKVEST